MDLYTFKVDKFKIHKTLARHEDTLYLAYAASVDGDIVAQKVLALGDRNDGDFVPDNLVPDADKGGLARVVINDPMSTAAFNFQLVNAGNVPQVLWPGDSLRPLTNCLAFLPDLLLWE